jgi:hypothetical protein
MRFRIDMEKPRQRVLSWFALLTLGGGIVIACADLSTGNSSPTGGDPGQAYSAQLVEEAFQFLLRSSLLRGEDTTGTFDPPAMILVELVEKCAQFTASEVQADAAKNPDAQRVALALKTACQKVDAAAEQHGTAPLSGAEFDTLADEVEAVVRPAYDESLAGLHDK